MHGFFDNTMCAAHCNARKPAWKPQVFVQIHEDIVTWVVDKTLLERILAETGSWKNVHDDLNAVGSSQLGSRLFGFALGHVLAEVVADAIEKRLGELVDCESVVTPASLEVGKKEALAIVQAMENVDGLPLRRQLMLKYRGFELPEKVSSLGGEADMRFATRLKALACMAVDIDPLSCEGRPAARTRPRWSRA